MATAITNMATQRDLRATSPEGLFLRFIAAKATISAIDGRLMQDGRDPTVQEDADWSASEDLAADISDEFKRRLQTVLGDVKLDDLLARGVL